MRNEKNYPEQNVFGIVALLVYILNLLESLIATSEINYMLNMSRVKKPSSEV